MNFNEEYDKLIQKERKEYNKGIVIGVVLGVLFILSLIL